MNVMKARLRVFALVNHLNKTGMISNRTRVLWIAFLRLEPWTYRV